MPRKRGRNGSGSIDSSGENAWRIRYRVEGRRFAVHFKGTKKEAQAELTRLLHAGDTGKHIVPNNKLTLAQWIDRWLALKEPNLKARTYERYEIFLKRQVEPVLGARLLQKITPTDVDDFYKTLELAPRTLAVVHTVLKACFATAVKKKLRHDNPVDDAERPAVDDAESIGATLDENELMQLVRDFRGTTLHGFVAVACLTGMRRNEALALRWVDINFDAATITVTRSVEETKKHGRRVSTPKTGKSVRTFKVDAGLTALLRAEREKHLRLIAGVPDGAQVDLSLVKLPADTLVFPAIGTNLTAIRSPTAVSEAFNVHIAKLGTYPEALRLHDLRGSHETALLDRGVALHVVAARCGHSPATLLKSYAKRTKKSDESVANVLGTMTAEGL